MKPTLKSLVWIRDARKNLKSFPNPVKRSIGTALCAAQAGLKHKDAKPLTGHNDFKGGKVLEVVDDYDGETYRAIYTVKFPLAIYVLHSFHKKSKKGISTPKHEIDLIQQRLMDAEQRYDDWTSGKRESP